jgi:putative flavoprotein involved in K+ transport
MTHPDHTPEISTRPADCLDVIVIGAGQAGLALGWHLTQQQARYVIVDGAPALGHSWRSRWDSLRLFSPAEYDSLPGMDFPAGPGTYPSKDQVADYLAEYAERFHLPVLLSHRVTRLTRDPETEVFTVHTGQGPLRARQVVVATGPFQKPHLPDLANGLDGQVTQLHSARYRNPGQLPAGPVLVVGAGNSGLQIAEELATHPGLGGTATREVHLAVGATLPQLPQRLLGRDLFWWLTKTGAINKPATSLVARRMRARGDLVIGTSRARVAELGVTLRPRVSTATGASVEFADGSRLAPASIVWATGFVPDYTWIDVPDVIVDDANPGGVRHRRGVTGTPGLYFLGLAWQHTRGSALLGFVRHDAAWLANQIHAHRPHGSRNTRARRVTDQATTQQPTSDQATN